MRVSASLSTSLGVGEELLGVLRPGDVDKRNAEEVSQGEGPRRVHVVLDVSVELQGVNVSCDAKEGCRRPMILGTAESIWGRRSYRAVRRR